MESDAAKSAGEVQASGGQSSIVKADVSSDKQVRSMVGQVLEKWGRLDILVNNAGIYSLHRSRQPGSDGRGNLDSIFAVNLQGRVLLLSRRGAGDEKARQRKSDQHRVRRRNHRQRKFDRLLRLQGWRHLRNPSLWRGFYRLKPL